jgi:hypothetical protein
MHRLARLTRPFSVLFALWFAAVLGDAGVLRSCPMHGGGHGMATSPHAAQAMHHGQAAHGAMHAEHGSPTGDSHHAPGPCTCVGHCCATPAAAPLAFAPALSVPVEVLAERDPLQSAASVPRATPTLRLPFANGPPAV